MGLRKYVRVLAAPGKVFLPALLAISCTSQPGVAPENPIRVLLDLPPVTLLPRHVRDAIGQRIDALVFGALTRIDPNLDPQPDLSSGWRVLDSGRTWKFDIRPGIRDHSGQAITPDDLVRCLENYRIGKPISAHVSAFPHWIGTRASNASVSILLKDPDPYLARNISLLRFFRVNGNPDPCVDPRPGQKLVGSGPYRIAEWNPAPEDEVTLIPVDPAKRALRFSFIQDENALMLKLLRGEGDVTSNSVGLSKTRLLKSNYADRFDIFEREGTSIAYLAFNLKDPLLSRLEVRRAIALALDRADIVRSKLFGFATVAGSFLSPLLPESFQIDFPYNPEESERILNRAGFKRDADGVRFKIHYKTTPRREGYETAEIFQEMLEPIGIKLVIDVVEPAVFFASVRKGNFQLFSSRYLGVADGSIFFRPLDSKLSPVHYSDPEMDRLLEYSMGEIDLARRKPALRQIQSLMARDLPYFPLWFWDNTVLVRKGLTGLDASQISLSGAFEPLTHLK